MDMKKGFEPEDDEDLSPDEEMEVIVVGMPISNMETIQVRLCLPTETRILVMKEDRQVIH
jgi:hypothetical protein